MSILCGGSGTEDDAEEADALGWNEVDEDLDCVVDEVFEMWHAALVCMLPTTTSAAS